MFFSSFQSYKPFHIISKPGGHSIQNTEDLAVGIFQFHQLNKENIFKSQLGKTCFTTRVARGTVSPRCKNECQTETVFVLHTTKY